MGKQQLTQLKAFLNRELPESPELQRSQKFLVSTDTVNRSGFQSSLFGNYQFWQLWSGWL